MSFSCDEDLVNLSVANLTKLEFISLKVMSFGNILDVFVCNKFKFQVLYFPLDFHYDFLSFFGSGQHLVSVFLTSKQPE